MPTLRELLVQAELSEYYQPLLGQLKVSCVQHLKYVSLDDLISLGLSRPQARRLIKFYRKQEPRGPFSRLKKVLLRGSSEETPRVAQSTPASPSVGPKPQICVPAACARPPAGRHLISAESILLGRMLGEGEFGLVQQGVWKTEIGEMLQVAVKRLSRTRVNTGTQNFLKEAAIMQDVDHDHIVRMFGVVLEAEDNIMLVTELAPMCSLLQCLRDPALRPDLSVTRLVDYAVQVCDGMAYLETKRLVHRDLAARNILVFSKHQVKISDLGLSRMLGVGQDYYQSKFSVSLKLPIAWCAPECINFLKFTSASDVWSFAVTVWEFFTYGLQPWAGLSAQQILQAIDEPHLQRLEKPDLCPRQIYQLMLECWQHLPEVRPKFSDILSRLPQMRPVLVKAVRDYPGLLVEKGHVYYQAGDVIAVIDKSPVNSTPAGLVWKGVLTNGKCGLFDPTNAAPFIDPDIMPVVKKMVTISRKDSARKSGRKIKGDMISQPNDLRHTGHIGFDGAVFGDVSFIGDNYDKLPVKGCGGNVGEAETVNAVHIYSNTSCCGHNGSVSHSPGSRETLQNKMQKSWDSQELTNGHLEQDGRSSPSYQDIDDEPLLTDHKIAELASSFDCGPSFMDEVFKALDEKTKQTTPISHSQLIDRSPGSRHEPPLPAPREPRLSGSSSSSGPIPVATPLPRIETPKETKKNKVKSMSASEEKMIDACIARARELTSHFGGGLSPPVSPSQASDKLFSFDEDTGLISRLKNSMKRTGSPKHERKRTFSEELEQKTDQDEVTPEVQQAYNLLVVKGSFLDKSGSGQQLVVPHREELRRSVSHPLAKTSPEVGSTRRPDRDTTVTSPSLSRSFRMSSSAKQSLFQNSSNSASGISLPLLRPAASSSPQLLPKSKPSVAATVSSPIKKDKNATSAIFVQASSPDNKRFEPQNSSKSSINQHLITHKKDKKADIAVFDNSGYCPDNSETEIKPEPNLIKPESSIVESVGRSGSLNCQLHKLKQDEEFLHCIGSSSEVTNVAPSASEDLKTTADTELSLPSLPAVGKSSRGLQLSFPVNHQKIEISGSKEMAQSIKIDENLTSDLSSTSLSQTGSNNSQEVLCEASSLKVKDIGNGEIEGKSNCNTYSSCSPRDVAQSALPKQKIGKATLVGSKGALALRVPRLQFSKKQMEDSSESMHEKRIEREGLSEHEKAILDSTEPLILPNFELRESSTSINDAREQLESLVETETLAQAISHNVNRDGLTLADGSSPVDGGSIPAAKISDSEARGRVSTSPVETETSSKAAETGLTGRQEIHLNGTTDRSLEVLITAANNPGDIINGGQVLTASPPNSSELSLFGDTPVGSSSETSTKNISATESQDPLPPRLPPRRSQSLNENSDKREVQFSLPPSSLRRSSSVDESNDGEAPVLPPREPNAMRTPLNARPRERKFPLQIHLSTPEKNNSSPLSPILHGHSTLPRRQKSSPSVHEATNLATHLASPRTRHSPLTSVTPPRPQTSCPSPSVSSQKSPTVHQALTNHPGFHDSLMSRSLDLSANRPHRYNHQNISHQNHHQLHHQSSVELPPPYDVSVNQTSSSTVADAEPTHMLLDPHSSHLPVLLTVSLPPSSDHSAIDEPTHVCLSSLTDSAVTSPSSHRRQLTTPHHLASPTTTRVFEKRVGGNMSVSYPNFADNQSPPADLPPAPPTPSYREKLGLEPPKPKFLRSVSHNPNSSKAHLHLPFDLSSSCTSYRGRSASTNSPSHIKISQVMSPSQRALQFSHSSNIIHSDDDDTFFAEAPSYPQPYSQSPFHPCTKDGPQWSPTLPFPDISPYQISSPASPPVKKEVTWSETVKSSVGHQSGHNHHHSSSHLSTTRTPSTQVTNSFSAVPSQQTSVLFSKKPDTNEKTCAHSATHTHQKVPSAQSFQPPHPRLVLPKKESSRQNTNIFRFPSVAPADGSLHLLPGSTLSASELSGSPTADGPSSCEVSPLMFASYNGTSSVSYEDLRQFAVDSQKNCEEIETLLKIFQNQVSVEECMTALEGTQWDVTKATKYLQLKKLLTLGVADVHKCKEALCANGWDIQSAAEVLLESSSRSRECLGVRSTMQLPPGNRPTSPEVLDV